MQEVVIHYKGLFQTGELLSISNSANIMKRELTVRVPTMFRSKDIVGFHVVIEFDMFMLGYEGRSMIFKGCALRSCATVEGDSSKQDICFIEGKPEKPTPYEALQLRFYIEK